MRTSPLLGCSCATKFYFDATQGLTLPQSRLWYEYLSSLGRKQNEMKLLRLCSLDHRQSEMRVRHRHLEMELPLGMSWRWGRLGGA